MSKKLSQEERFARDLADEELREKEDREERERNSEIYDLLARLKGPAICIDASALQDALVFLLERAKT